MTGAALSHAYDGYIWAAYGISAVALVLCAGLSWWLYRRTFRRIQTLAIKS